MCRHCEKQSDEAISKGLILNYEIAASLARLAMTRIFQIIRASLTVCWGSCTSHASQ